VNEQTVPVIFAIMASAIVVLGGLVALTRSIWHAAQDIRDNKIATVKNTEAIGELSVNMDGRLTVIESRLSSLEHRGSP
jgi:hypothetical protein